MSQKSLGLIETTGLTAAIEAADAAVKSANVELVGYELAKGGGMTVVKLYGEVGAVNAAVAAATAAAAKINAVVSTKVIARPADGMECMVISEETVGADLPKPPEPPEPTPPTGGGDGPKSGPDDSGNGGSEKGSEATGNETGADAPVPEQTEGKANAAPEEAKSEELDLQPVSEVKPIESAKPAESATKPATTRKTGRGRRRRA
nr:BMC domain-containing protein [uncultured Cohaesibacter sp.]